MGTREFVVEEPRRSVCTVAALSPTQLGFDVTCDDNFYGFEDVKLVHLGKFLDALGLTADDCSRAIAEWRLEVSDQRRAGSR